MSAVPRRKALITGAAGGMGRACARLLVDGGGLAGMKLAMAVAKGGVDCDGQG